MKSDDIQYTSFAIYYSSKCAIILGNVNTTRVPPHAKPETVLPRQGAHATRPATTVMKTTSTTTTIRYNIPTEDPAVQTTAPTTGGFNPKGKDSTTTVPPTDGFNLETNYSDPIISATPKEQGEGHLLNQSSYVRPKKKLQFISILY